jgi:hypothetical protein
MYSTTARAGASVARKRITAEEWRQADDPFPMLQYGRGMIRPHGRKLRLFAVACCRLVWDNLLDERSRKAVEVAERFADGDATDEALRTAAVAATAAHDEMFAAVGKSGSGMEWAASSVADPRAYRAATNVSWMAACLRSYEVRTRRPDQDWDDFTLVPCAVRRRSGPLSLLLGRWKVTRLEGFAPTGAEKPVQADLLRCIFGNPFQPATFDPAWRTPAAVALGRSIYDERRFADLPILADALEEAGCSEVDIVSHCRAPRPHARGCWIVDLLLGKSAE